MADKKPPATGDDAREIYRVKTPPQGVSSQIAPKEFERPSSENWDGEDTGAGEAHDEDTPVGLEQMAAVVQTADNKAESRLRHRVKKTAETAEQIKTTIETTNVGIDTLRLEHKTEIAAVKTEVAAVKTEVAGLSVKIDANNQMTKFVADQFPVLISALATDRKMTQEEDHFVRRKVVEVKAHEATAQIDDAKERNKFKRKALMKAISGVVALLTSGAVIGFAVTHLSC